MRFFLAWAMTLVSMHSGSAAPAPFLSQHAILPSQVQAYLTLLDTDNQGRIGRLSKRLLKAKDEKSRVLLAAQIKRCWRSHFQSVIGTLKNCRDVPEKTVLGRRLSEGEVRAINRAIADYERRWAEAVRRGLADPPSGRRTN